VDPGLDGETRSSPPGGALDRPAPIGVTVDAGVSPGRRNARAPNRVSITPIERMRYR
jgi:hypothetical protein